MHVRIGLSAGEPVYEDGDLFGSTVQLAARLCGSAEPDMILICKEVHDLCKQEEYTISDKGVFTPKGFSEHVQFYEVTWQNP